MAITVNKKAVANAKKLINAGKYDSSSGWEAPSASDENKILGADKDNWTEFSKWYLATDNDYDNDVKNYYKYPYSDDFKTVARAGLIAIRQRAGQQKEQDIFDAAGSLIDMIDKKEGRKSIEIKSDEERYISLPFKAIKSDDDEDGVITGIISTTSPDRGNDIMDPAGARLKNFYANPVVLYEHNKPVKNPPIGRCVGIQATPDGLIAKTYFNRTTQLSKDLYNLYKNGDMFAFSIGYLSYDNYIDDDGNCVHTDWEMIEYSVVSVPMNADCTTLSFDDESISKRKNEVLTKAIEDKILDKDSTTLELLGYKTMAKEKTKIETKKMSEDDTNEIFDIVKDLSDNIDDQKKALGYHQDAMSEHADAIKTHSKAFEHLKANDDGDDDVDVDMHKAAVEDHSDAFDSHAKAFKKSLKSLEGYQKTIGDLQDHLKSKGYDTSKIDDDVDASKAPFKVDQTTGGGDSGNVANVLDNATNATEFNSSEVLKSFNTMVEEVKTIKKALVDKNIITDESKFDPTEFVKEMLK